ncbi:MAG: GNAT family N-acetyltransferase [Bacteroidales bacterium]|nr:GNAT family N-acetyltransferase [Bacteroidales bacterium]
MLKGENVLLRPVEIKDVDSLYHWENDPENWLVSNTITPFSKFFLEQYVVGAQNDIYADRQLRLIIEDHEGRTCGAIDLFDFDPHHRRAGIGILIEAESRGKGLGTEALQLVIDYAANTLNLHQLHCTIDHDNERSLSLFKKMGFELSGNRKHWTWRPDGWMDEHFLQLILKKD